MYQTIKITNQFKLNIEQKKIIKDLAFDLDLIKKHVPFIEDIIVRAGFILDVLLGVTPFDIDAFYTTKEQVGTLFSKCRCDEIRELIKNIDFKLINKKHPLDLGHFGEGEIYIPAIEKIIGFHSHQIDIADMVCVDSEGNLWSNNEAIYCIKNRIHEIRFDGWMLYPYFIRVFPHVDYNYYYTVNCLRGLKMIYTKNYKSIGSNFKMLLENSKPIIDYTCNIPNYKKEIQKYYNNKCREMSREDFRKVLKITKVSNQEYLYSKLVEMIFSEN